MIVNYGVNPEILPFLRANLYMHENKDHPVYMNPSYIGTVRETQLYALTPYATKPIEVVQEIEEVVRKGLFGKKVEKRPVVLIKHEPKQESKGFAFVSTENRPICQTLCFVPVLDQNYDAYPNETKKSKYNPQKAHFYNAQFAISPELLMPILINQPKTLEDAINLVHVDPRFLMQIDPAICKNEEEMKLLYEQAKEGYNRIMSYQEHLGIKSPEEDPTEAKEREAFKTLCTDYGKIFVSKFINMSKKQQDSSKDPVFA